MISKETVAELDLIINNTVDAIEKGKSQLVDISDVARREKKRIEEEFEREKKNVIDFTNQINELENHLTESKKQLLLSNKYYEKYTEEEKKAIYEKTENLRIELAVKRELEQMSIKKRNELELRAKDADQMVAKTDNLISTVGTAMNILTGNMNAITSQLDDIQQRQEFGIRIIRAQEDERKRVAREIHDGPAQSMANVVLKAEICQKLFATDIEAAKDEIKSLKENVKDSLQDIRRIIYDLRPMSLDDLGLIPTMQRHVTTFLEENKMPIAFRTRGNFENINSVISLTIFRILQEALSNIKKYANANNILISLEMVEEDIVFSVSDNGVGFDIEKIKLKGADLSGGFGLFSMKERVELLDGKFDLVSEVGKGTKITARIPTIINN